MHETNDPAIRETVAFVEARLPAAPQIVLILGSGLGAFAQDVTDATIIPTTDIPGYPRSTVAGHAGRLVSGTIEGVNVLVVQGRVHYYEGYHPSEVVIPVRLAAALGAKGLVVTNAAGGLGDHVGPGDLMAITDHINMMGTNPLIGQNWGFDRFPDMSRAYDPDLRGAMHRAAKAEDIELKEGVLAAWMGPSYETASEIRMMKAMGVSSASMSTVPEVIAASRLKLRTAGISCITNLATGISEGPLTHEEVTETAALVEEKFRCLLKASVPEMAKEL